MYVEYEDELKHKMKLFYNLHGNDDAPNKIVFIMGWIAAHTAWENMVEFVNTHPTDYQCVVFDNRGVGHSTAPDVKYSMKMMASDVIALVDHLGWQKFHVIGASMGGMISLRLATMIPERIQTLTLMATRADGGLWFALPPLGTIWNFAKMMWFSKVEDQVYYHLENQFPVSYLDSPRKYVKTETEENSVAAKIETNREYLIKKQLARRAKVPPASSTGMWRQLQAIYEHQITENELLVIRNAGFKILVMTGDNDGMVPHHHSLKLKEKLNSDFMLLPGAGHGILDHYDTEIRAKLREFLVM